MKKVFIFYKLILTIFYLVGSPGILFAQQLDQEDKIIFSKNGTIKYIKFGEDETLHYKTSQGKEIEFKVTFNSSDFFNQILEATEDDQFKLIRKRQTRTGYIIEKYAQSYKDITVKDAKYSLHFYDGKLFKANGKYVKIKDLDIVPSISPDEAMKRFAEFQNIPLSEIKNYESKLLIVEIKTIKDGDIFMEPKLAYEIILISNNHPKNTEIGFVEVHTGEIIKTEPIITNYSATGTFYTRYSGTQTATTQYYNNTYNLCDSTRGAIIRTRNNLNHYPDWYMNAPEFTDNNNTWTTDEHSSNYDDMALDIHWALQEIYDYFYDTFNGWIGYNNSDTAINAYAHTIFSYPYANKDNAGWSDGYHNLYFGDGQDIFKPLASLDCVAHEYGHGIEHLNPGLGYSTIELALREGLSDIWGAVLEYNIAPAKVHWKIAEEIMDNGKDCLRNIAYPKASTAHTKMADTYNGQYYDGTYYQKSGVFSHWFYLLSDGGSGTNDLSNDYLVYGIGINCATEIIFEAEIDHFDGVDSYPEARTATIDAAGVLYGENSLEVIQVKDAWYAVGVGSQPSQLSISGPDLVCTSNSTFVLHNRPSGTTVYWTKGYGLSYVSGQYTDNYTVKASSISSSSSWVKATITSDCGNVTVQKNIWVGKVLPLGLRIIDRRTGYPIYIFCVGEAHPVQAKHIDGEAFLDDWDWDVTNGYITYDNPYGDNSKATLRPLNYNFGVEIRAHNDCGWSEWVDMDPYTIFCGYMMFTMQPNPTDDFVEITAYEDVNKTTLKSNDKYYEVQIYNTMKVLKYQVITKEPILRINTANFENGLYFVHFIFGKEAQVLQLVISH